MALLHCNHCHTTRDCKLDPDNDNVICMECGNVVEGVSPFFVNTMKSRREYVSKKREAFRFMCDKCNKEMRGVLSKNGSQVLCSKCETPMNVSFYMMQAMKSIDTGDDSAEFSKEIVEKVKEIKASSKENVKEIKDIDTEDDNTELSGKIKITDNNE